MNYLANAPSYSDILNGFVTENGNTYYYENGVKVTGWKRIPDYSNIYYFDSNGVMKTGWMTSASGVTAYYFHSNGKLATGLTEIDGYYYYFYESGESDGTRGQLMTGWRVISGSSRYFIPEGAFNGTAGKMATGFTDIGSYTYFFNTDGSMHKGWKKKSGYTYYFTDGSVSPAVDPTSTAGRMKTGFAENLAVSSTNSGTYYFDSEGRMQKGWVKKSGYTYYFNDGSVSPADDSTSKVGQMKTGLVENLAVSSTNSGTYYFDSEGRMQKGWRKIGTDTYYFTDGSVSPADSSTSKVGQMKTGLVENLAVSSTNSGTYYFGTDGKMKTGYHTVNGVECYFREGTTSPANVPSSTVGQLAEMHTVTFVTSRGSMNSVENPITVLDGFPIGTLPILTSSRWVFLGWADSDGEIIDDDYIVSEDVTLTAQWEIVEGACNIKCYSEGVLVYDVTPWQGVTSLDIILPPEREGYTFTGWYDSNGQAVGRIMSDYVLIDVPNVSELILTAGWEQN